MMSKQITWLMTALAIVVMASGCTAVQKGAAVGASGGAIVGGLWGSSGGGALNAGEGAAVGAAAGGLVGALLADSLIEEEAMMVDGAEVENLKQQLADSEILLQEKTNALSEKEYALAAKEKEMEDLQTKLNLAKAELDKIASSGDKNSERIAELEKLLADATKKLGKQELVTEDLRQKLAEASGELQEKEENVDALRQKLDELEVTLSETAKGLELTILNELLFAEGKDEISDEGKSILDEIAKIVKERFPDREIVIEGHTDNQPIKVSGWKSNWELGAARSLAVLHYLEDQWAFKPVDLSAVTYGQWRPVGDNDTDEGRSGNRRAVIIIYPEDLQITKERSAM